MDNIGHWKKYIERDNLVIWIFPKDFIEDFAIGDKEIRIQVTEENNEWTIDLLLVSVPKGKSQEVLEYYSIGCKEDKQEAIDCAVWWMKRNNEFDDFIHFLSR